MPVFSYMSELQFADESGTDYEDCSDDVVQTERFFQQQRREEQSGYRVYISEDRNSLSTQMLHASEINDICYPGMYKANY